jgi:hypothetical protein
MWRLIPATRNGSPTTAKGLSITAGRLFPLRSVRGRSRPASRWSSRRAGFWCPPRGPVCMLSRCRPDRRVLWVLRALRAFRVLRVRRVIPATRGRQATTALLGWTVRLVLKDRRVRTALLDLKAFPALPGPTAKTERPVSKVPPGKTAHRVSRATRVTPARLGQRAPFPAPRAIRAIRASRGTPVSRVLPARSTGLTPPVRPTM